MSKLRIAYAASAVLAFWLADVSQTQAQYRNTAPLSRGVPSVRGFGRARVVAPNRNIRGLRGRGTDTLIFGDSGGRDFARTIPRVFGSSILPYYALYPPVYYSMPVPRPYGFSPFALPPGVQPAEGIPVPVEAEVTLNPYFKPKADADQEKESPAQQASTRLHFITNPYYVKRITPAESKRLAASQAANVR